MDFVIVNKLVSRPMSLLLLFIAGALMPLAHAPLNWWPISFLSLMVLLYYWLRQTPKQSFYSGLAWGLGHFGVGVSWIFISIHRYGNTHAILAGILTLLFISLLALFIAIQGSLLARLYNRRSMIRKSLIGFPCSWLLFEYGRSHFLTGFPWLLSGYSQLDSPLSGFAPIIGVYGISFLVATISGLLVLLLLSPAKKSLLLSCVLLFCTGFVLKHITWTSNTQTHTVILSQGNISPKDKFLLDDPIAVAWNTYAPLTIPKLPSDLIIWPENALPLPRSYAHHFLTTLDHFFKKHHSTLLMGLPIDVPNDSKHFYNSILALGEGSGAYHKQHLVPFGEYLPFEHWLRGLINFFNIPMSSFIPGPPLDNITGIELPNQTILPALCYEIAYPEALRKKLQASQAETIVTISEDGWFGNSWGPHQHLAIARMRALETGRFVLRGTSSGISAIIDSHGKIVQQSPQFVPYVISGHFDGASGNTPWNLLGLIPLVILSCIGFVIGLIVPGK